MGDHERDDPADHERDDDLGPKEGTDDSTKADMGLGGPPAQSATPVGQGDEPGTGADVDDDAQGAEPDD
jgi:hypothetical protein